MKIYVLVGEYSEYENHTTMVLGTFTSETAAREAIPKIVALGEQQWALHLDYKAMRAEYLTRFEPDKVFPAGSPFPDGCVLYKNEHYAEAAAALGPAPEFNPTCEEYRIECFGLDNIEMPQVLAVGQTEKAR